jgi:hypothetical protein
MVKGFFAKEKTLTGKKTFMLVAQLELLVFLVIHLVLLL